MTRTLRMFAVAVLAATATMQVAQAAPAKTELMLFCAAGVRTAMDTLIDTFKTREAGTTVQVMYDGSGKLLAQVSTLHKGDLLLAGEAFYMVKACEQKLMIDSTIDTVTYYVPVIFVQKGNPKGIAAIADLAKPGLRIGLGDERACAVGKVAADIIQRSGVSREALDKNVVVKTGTVTELGTAIQMKTVDVVIVWAAIAHQFGQYGDAVALPTALAGPVPVPLGVLRSSTNVPEAIKFVKFLKSDVAQRILTRNGYPVKRPDAK